MKSILSSCFILKYPRNCKTVKQIYIFNSHFTLGFAENVQNSKQLKSDNFHDQMQIDSMVPTTDLSQVACLVWRVVAFSNTTAEN